MSDMMIWVVILTLGMGTFLLRFSFIYLAGRVDLPASLTRALRYVPPAVLSAIILPALMRDHTAGGLSFSPVNPYLLAGIIAAIAAWKTRSVLISLAVGMGSLWLLQWLLG